MKKDKTTIRTSPTISKLSYEIFKTYGIPISNFLERESMGIVFNDEKLKNERWHEIKLKENQIKFYEEEKRILDKKIAKLNNEIEELKESLTDSIREETAKNIQKAQETLYNSHITPQRLKKEKSMKEDYRYDIKKMSIDDVYNICENNNVTPKMVLPLIPHEIIKNYFDKKCEKFIK